MARRAASGALARPVHAPRVPGRWPVALLVTHGLSGIEALITHAAAGDVPVGILRATRGWPDEAWNSPEADTSRSEAGSRGQTNCRLTEWGPTKRRR